MNQCGKKQNRVVVEIAGVVVAICSDRLEATVQLGNSYRDFFCDGEPEITLHLQYEGLPPIALRDEDRVFDSETVWRLFRIGGRNAIVLGAYDSGLPPYQIALFDDEIRRVEVYSEPVRRPDGMLPDPLGYLLSQVLMVCLLARARGLMVHACGIDDGGRGYLFAGNSTHGKSTMARLWAGRAAVLNDDRIVLRRREGRFWMYGTPWHGDYTAVSPAGVPLEKLFFLRHADRNRAQRVEPVTAASMLLSRCFLPLWDATGMEYTLDFCAGLAEAVPCYELGFVPDEDVMDFVRCVS
jgi:hypothetical protein